ncbi:hypothetical protein UPYG_G00194560 [Umbra pygmaea]|uniref:Tripartite motif-containing protein 16-like n=1 Tax=Umbra pygmaea TaxID=75934 RepID=A0ABD0WZ27_UMBPY
MATALWTEEDFVCSVCLETLHEPATIPCGHTYCLPCIQGHWDRDEAMGQFSCPQCRQVFTPRPALAKSTLLVKAMEKLRRKNIQEHLSLSSASPSMPAYLEVCMDTDTCQGGLYSQVSIARMLCPQHQQPLGLYCLDDKESVCKECCHHGHKGHRVVKLEEERKEREREISHMLAETRRRIQERETELRTFPQDAQIQKGLVRALQNEAVELFSEFMKSVELMGTQVRELLCTHEASMGSWAEDHLHRLEQELAQLRLKDQELTQLASTQDHVFFKNVLTLEPLTQNWGREAFGQVEEEAFVSEVQTVMGELRDGLQDLCKTCLAKIFRSVNDLNSANSPSQPCPPFPPSQPQANQVSALGLANLQSKTREEMLKFRLNLTFDPNTAYRHLKLSNGDRKATLKADKQNHPDHPDRFLYWRQILCRESLAGSPYYWEMEWTGQKITVGVAYKHMNRREADDSSRLGHNEQSWGLNWSGTGFSMWHTGKETQIGSIKARRLGVYLDQHKGVLAFYRISNNHAELIHSLETDFSGPLYPGFRFWSGVGESVTLCQLDESKC